MTVMGLPIYWSEVQWSLIVFFVKWFPSDVLNLKNVYLRPLMTLSVVN